MAAREKRAWLGLLLPVYGMITPGLALDNGMALTPPMGWNSWNAFNTHINEDLIKRTADAMVASGMAAAGYRYINIDDCWSSKARDAKGDLVADPTTFPGGIKALADYVHSKGLKLGIYSDRGSTTCAGYPGSEDHEAQDAATWAAWGVDYLKYDNCNAKYDQRTQYFAMRDALAACGRPMVFSVCAWGFEPWMPPAGNLWRTTTDINPGFGKIMEIVDENAPLAAYAKPGAWNDPDMLEVGNGDLTAAENRAHFSLWAMMAAPLIAGNDLRSMPAATAAILTNAEVIAVDQDSLGKQGARIRTTGGVELWSKPLRDGSVAVLVFNRSGGSMASLTFTLPEVGITRIRTAEVRDLWAHGGKSQAYDAYSATVASHDVAMYRLVPGPDRTPPKIRRVVTSPDSARQVVVVFDEPLDTLSAEAKANYALNQGLAITSAVLQADRQSVILDLATPLVEGVSYQGTANGVTDASGNAIAANSAFAFTYSTFKRITKIRYYPRRGYEGRMVGGLFEGTRSTDRDSATWVILHAITALPAGNTWTEVTTLANNADGYRFVRYRAPAKGYGNVAEIEFYGDAAKLGGAAFGTPGSYDGPGDDFSKAFDGDVNTIFDCTQPDGAFTGLDLVSDGAKPVSLGPSPGYRRAAQPASPERIRGYDLQGKRLASRPVGARIPGGSAGAPHLAKRQDSDGAPGSGVSR